MAAVMVLQGAVFSVLNGVLDEPRSEGGWAIYLAVMISFLNGIDSAASVCFGALLSEYWLVACRCGRLRRPFEERVS